MNRGVRTFGSVQTKPAVACVHCAALLLLACRPHSLALVAYERRTRPEGSGEVSCRLHSCVLRKKNGLAVLLCRREHPERVLNAGHRHAGELPRPRAVPLGRGSCVRSISAASAVFHGSTKAAKRIAGACTCAARRRTARRAEGKGRSPELVSAAEASVFRG